MEKTKLFQFFNKINLIFDLEWNSFFDATNIKILRDKNKNIKVKILISKVLEPKLLFNFIERTKLLDDSIRFEYTYNYQEITIFNVFEYLVYFLEHNNVADKEFLQAIFSRKRGKIVDDTFFIFYLNQNEKHILVKNLKIFLNFLSNHGFGSLKLDTMVDENEKELQLLKKNIEDKATMVAKSKTTTEDNIVKFKAKKNISGEVVNICDLIVEMQKAIIVAEIFKIDTITTRTGLTIYKFYVTDYTDSIVIKMIPKKNELSELVKTLKVGTWIKASVSLNIDTYENNDLTAVAFDIIPTQKPKKFIREDDAITKRIEFINHTNMTAFEGLINVKSLFELAHKFGHKALAITDKFNCQNFPEVFNISKKYPDIKVMYGVQFNKINSHIEIVSNPQDAILEKGTYVLFDLETTGLSPYYDKIIEFGAIKYQKGKIIDSIQFFINPEENVSAKVFNLTRISNEQLKKGIKIEEALLKIKDFIGDSILIAHNGIKFDLPFLNCKLEQLKMEKINNPLIDTMQVSRAVNEQISGHSLGAICRKFKIEYNENEAHRADKDSEYLLDVWKRFLNILHSKQIFNLMDINTQLQNDLLRSRNRGSLITLYCKNQNSIKSLYKLISISLTNNYFDSPKIFNETLNSYASDFLISNSPTEGDVIDYALSNTNDNLDELIKNNYDFITVSPTRCFQHEIDREVYKKEWIEDAIKRIIEIAKKYNKLTIASSDSYYLNENEIDYFKVYVYAKSIGGKRHRFYRYHEQNFTIPDLFFRNTQEMLDEFSFLKNHGLIYEVVVNNTNTIAGLIEPNIKPIKEELYSPNIEGASESLKKLIYERAYDIFGDKIDDFIKERINREINSVINNGYSVVYWFSHLLVKRSMDDGFMVGSRGSVGSSVTAWLVNITEVCALPPHYLCKNCKYFKFEQDCQSGFDLPNINCPECGTQLIGDGHNIPFETFMGFEGDKIPDIDLNFSALYQGKAHDFIRDMFGKERVFRAGTISTVAEKTAYGYVKAYFEETGNYHAKQAEINRLAVKCENVKRTTGQHPGGIIVVPHENDVYDFSPFNFPADDTSQDWYTTHFAFESLHDSLLKFDILGHDNPTVLRMLSQQTGVDPNTIPNHDKQVIDLFNSTDSLNIKHDDINQILRVGSSGIPEFGTNFVKEMLLITRPKNFSDLIRISGLSHGTMVWNDNAKNLIEENGLEISDVISCRDDIMVYLMNKGIQSKIAFKIMEDVRKGKGLKDEYIAILKENNIPEWYINSCNKIQYLFPKAHATAYVIMAWKIAWFKIYYPLHFYASFFSIRTEVFDIKSMVEGKNSILEKLNDIKRRSSDPKLKSTVKTKEIDLIQIYEISLELIGRGFYIANIDLNKSHATEFIVEDDHLIPPFSTIDGLGSAVANSIIEARNIKPFTSKEDLKSRTKITNTHFKIMDELKIISHLEDDDQLTLFK